MNVLEHYIKEVISVEPYRADWADPNQEYVKIKVVVNCYGHVQERMSIERVEDWETIFKRGYFLW